MINDIHTQIGKQFDGKKLEAFTVKLNLGDMSDWASSVAEKRQIDVYRFQDAVRELYWGIGTIQLNLGYTLIALKECPYPSGLSGMVLNDGEVPDAALADYYFWHHLHDCYEAIYRFWERCVTVLRLRLTPKLKTKYYFDGYVNFLVNSGDSTLEGVAKPLRRYLRSWNKVASRRNRISHERSNPFLNTNIDVSFSDLSDYQGRRIAKYTYQLPNLKQELNTVINHYKRTHDLLYAVKSICDADISPNYTFKDDLGDASRPSAH